ncbi:MAG: hypothetical protein LW850_20370 [Planctomycetaceae bacterium]|jgi:hypothetical protein|nr:hypothetical protein [Planctomycetaceae bacterium]MCE2812749.1 hypothetical protein [Planctomycetaceae bacterium]
MDSWINTSFDFHFPRDPRLMLIDRSGKQILNTLFFRRAKVGDTQPVYRL